MKKVVLFLMSAVLFVVLAMTGFASAASVSFSTPDSVMIGERFKVTVKINGSVKGTSFGVSISSSENVRFVSGKVIKGQGLIAEFDAAQKKAVYAVNQTTDLSGDLVEAEFELLSFSQNNAFVSAQVIVKNGADEVMNSNGQALLKQGCAVHTFSDWKKENGNYHTHVCSVCGFSETFEHTAAPENKLTVKEATCTEKGIVHFVCDVCNAEVDFDIPAHGHDLNVTECIQSPTIYSTGLMSGICKICGEETEQYVDPSFIDPETKIRIETTVGVFPENTQISIRKIDAAEEIYSDIVKALKTSDVTVFDIRAFLDDKSVLPTGSLKLFFPLPETLRSEYSVYFIGEDGSLKDLGDPIKNENEISIEADCVGRFCIVKDSVIQPEVNKEKSRDPVKFVIIISALAAGLIIAGGVVMFVKKRK